MLIGSAEIKELEKLYESFKGQFPELEKELEQLIKTEDANVILLYSRRCLEVIISDLCECELKRPRKTAQLKGFLEIKVLKQKASQEYSDVNSNSPEALRKYVEGMELMTEGNFPAAIQSFQEAYKNDTTFTLAAFYIAYACCYSSDIHQSREWVQKAYRGKERLSVDYQLWLELWKANDSDGISKYNDLFENSDIRSRFFWYDIAYNYNGLGKYDKSVRAFEKIEKLNSEWGEDWKFRSYYKQGKYEESLKFLQKYKEKLEVWDPDFDQYLKKVQEALAREK